MSLWTLTAQSIAVVTIHSYYHPASSLNTTILVDQRMVVVEAVTVVVPKLMLRYHHLSLISTRLSSSSV